MNLIFPSGITQKAGQVDSRLVQVLKENRLQHERRQNSLRWGSATLLVILTGTVSLWCLTLMHATPHPVAAPPAAAIAIDLAPAPSPAPAPVSDVPPGPEQTVSTPVPQPDPPQLSAPPSPAPNPPVPVPKPEKHPPSRKPLQPSAHIKPAIPDKNPPSQQNAAPPSADASSAQPTAMPVAGASSSQASNSPMNWESALLARLEKFKRYPPEAQEAHDEGTAMLRFSMDRKGHVLSAQISTSSRHALLDEETLALLHRAEPLPAPPDSIAGDPVSLTVPIEFYLNAPSQTGR